MTVRDIIKTALAAEYEDLETDTDAVRHSIDVLNVLLIDCFEAEQNSRERDGNELLTAAPMVTALTDEVPYNTKLCRQVLPLGIEWKYAEQNLDMDRALRYQQMYEDAKQRAGGAAWL